MNECNYDRVALLDYKLMELLLLSTIGKQQSLGLLIGVVFYLS